MAPMMVWIWIPGAPAVLMVALGALGT